jgi:hypothetical protein
MLFFFMFFLWPCKNKTYWVFNVAIDLKMADLPRGRGNVAADGPARNIDDTPWGKFMWLKD